MDVYPVHADVFSLQPAVLEETFSIFEKEGIHSRLVSDECDSPHIAIGCRDIEEILDNIIEVSEKFPEETITVCYGGTQPGFQHEIIEACRNGELIIVSDVIEKMIN